MQCSAPAVYLYCPGVSTLGLRPYGHQHIETDDLHFRSHYFFLSIVTSGQLTIGSGGRDLNTSSPASRRHRVITLQE